MSAAPDRSCARLTKRQIAAALKRHGIAGTVSGSGSAWEVELQDGKAKNAFQKKVCLAGGFKTGYGGWVLKPRYTSQGDWNDPSSRWHY